MKKNVLVSFLGTSLDRGKREKRWSKWRPSVALCQHSDFPVDEYHIIYSSQYVNLFKSITDDIVIVSPDTVIIPHVIEFSDPWDFQEVFGKLLDFSDSMDFDLALKDYFIHITTGTHVAQICLFLLTEARYFPGRIIQTSPTGRENQCSGKYAVIDLDLSKYDKIAQRFFDEKQDDLSFLKSGIETKNHSFNNLISQIEQVALKSTYPLLLNGPTGAGKSKLAGRIFELKKMKRQITGEFVEVNCATLRGDNAMSALFGHKKGSFTGAVSHRAGLLKRADQGVLFLDEIGELGIDEQAMLLRAIEEKFFLPVGADKEISSDFQLICGTNRDLDKMVSRGLFRENLLSRINLWSFSLPGLRDRPEDIEPNIHYELKRFARTEGRQVSFSKEAFDSFITFANSPESLWSSNFRDLNGAVIRMATLAPGGRISEEVQREETERLKQRWEPQKDKEIDESELLRRFLSDGDLSKIDRFDRPQLVYVLKICLECRTISEAGRILFDQSRKEKKHNNDADRLRKYLNRFGLNWREIKESF